MSLKVLLIAHLFVLSFALPQTESIPDFSFANTKKERVTKASLSAGKPTIFLYFDPYCDHCMEQSELIKARYASFENINMIWVSWEELDAIGEFQTKYFPLPYKLHHFTKDDEYMIDEYFDYFMEVPTTIVFGSDGQRKKVFSDVAPIDELLQYAK